MSTWRKICVFCKQVVLKFPDDDVIGGAAVFARYKREAEIGNCLEHPAIVRHLNRGRAAEHGVPGAGIPAGTDTAGGDEGICP